MREFWRGVRLLIGTAWRADRRITLGVTCEPLGQGLMILVGLWLALLTTGVLTGRTGLIVTGVAGLVGGVAVGYLLGLYGNEWRLVLSEKVAHAFERRIASLTASLPGLDHHERPEYHDRLELLRQRQGMLGQSMNQLVNTVNSVFRGLVVLVLMVLVHPLMLLLVVLALPSIAVSRKQQAWHRAAEERSATPGRLARHLRRMAYDVDAGMEIRVFGLQREIGDRATRAWDDYRRPLLWAERRAALLGAAREVVFIAGAVAAVGFVLWRAINGQASPGDVVLAVYVSQQVQAAVVWPIQSVAGLGRTMRTASRLLWLEDYAGSAEAKRAGDLPAPERLTQGIVFEDVSFCYPGTDQWVLRNVSLTIPAGSVVALVGENGAGKTTLVKLLSRMYEPTGGRILVDGVDLADIDVEDWRRRMSAAFQDFAELEFTAGRSVGVGDLTRADDPEAVAGALERAGAADVTTALPAGIETQLGSSWPDGVDLSTGQWQKLALGRALMRTEPLLLCFDEPTASLDAPTEHALFERYADSARARSAYGAITVLVSHRFSTVRAADRIVVLDGGRVAQYGDHDELMRSGGLYAELYTLQERSYS